MLRVSGDAVRASRRDAEIEQFSYQYQTESETRRQHYLNHRCDLRARELQAQGNIIEVRQPKQAANVVPELSRTVECVSHRTSTIEVDGVVQVNFDNDLDSVISSDSDLDLTAALVASLLSATCNIGC